MLQEINKDQLTRMIAEAKLIGAMGQQTKTIGDETSNEKTAVIVDFSMIRIQEPLIHKGVDKQNYSIDNMSI